MIIDLTKENLSVIEGSFLAKRRIAEELEKNPYFKCYVYLLDNEVIGYIYFSEIYDRIEINQIEIIKAKRRTGYGNELLKKVINIGKSITLEVNCENIVAIKLYEKNGFKTVAKREKYYDGVDGLLMERK